MSDLHMSNNRVVRTGVLCLLYFAQGVPYGFVITALLGVLSEAGHAKSDTKSLVALAVLPWAFKFLWAPLVDSFRAPSYGLRRPWIIAALLGMAMTLLAVWFSGRLEETSTLTFLGWVFFAHNCFAALQDVATDALAVDLLDDSERGRVNGLMWGSKLFGTAVGGSGMAFVIDGSNIATAVLVQAIIVVSVLCVVLLVLERPGEKRVPWSRGWSQAPAASAPGMSFGKTISELLRALSLRTTLLAALMACTVHLCEGLYIPLTAEVFVQELKWTAKEFSAADGTYGAIAQLIGAIGGGLLCDRFGCRPMATIGIVLTSMTLLTFGWTAAQWGSESYPAVLLIPGFKGSLALTTVSLFSLYMKISWTSAAASQFTFYMTLSNMGRYTGTQLNGLNSWLLTEAEMEAGQMVLSNGHSYLLAGALALLPLFFLPWLRPGKVAERRARPLEA